MKLLNSTTYEGKEYTIQDGKGFISNESKGLPVGFYGGRVDKLAKTNKNGLYLCMEGMKVIDLIAFEDELNDLASKTNKELAAMLEEKGIEVPAKATKPELLELLEGVEQ